MDPVAESEHALAQRLVDEDGHDVAIELLPGLPPPEIDQLQAEVGAPLPADLRSLLGGQR